MSDQEPQAQSDLASFGEELRREREIRGISLKEIADATKISKRFLEALEGNDHRTLPAPVFTRGFVREYSRYLGLSADEMVTRYNVAAATDDRIEKSAHLERLVQPPVIQGDRSHRPASEHSTGRRYINAIALIIVGAGLAATVWWAVEQKRERARSEAATPPIVAPHVPRAIVPPVQTPPPEPEPLKLIVELTDDSWIDLQVDGQTVMRDDYRAGTRDSFEAKHNFTFKRIGDAAAVTLMLNGRQLPPLGRPGRVIKKLVLDRPYVEKLNATQ
ncbi:MAG TPA: RodZ domain-containing protein [Thermoanaerobaculia bacterium]|nr:RodZ domain-containing protein [Thermoanaerobaculia bacterium]